MFLVFIPPILNVTVNVVELYLKYIHIGDRGHQPTEYSCSLYFRLVLNTAVKHYH